MESTAEWSATGFEPQSAVAKTAVVELDLPPPIYHDQKTAKKENDKPETTSKRMKRGDLDPGHKIAIRGIGGLIILSGLVVIGLFAACLKF